MPETPVLAPDRVGSVQQLRPETSREIKLTPETEVLCIHRGRDPIEDTFDSQHYVILPGYFTIQLGAAKHFKDRAVVPGSRNPEIGKHAQASFIAIIGVAVPGVDGLRIEKPIDDADEWDPFTDAECTTFGMAIEAIDRGALTDAIDEKVDLVNVAAGQITGPGTPKRDRTKSKGAGAGRARAATRIEGPGADALKQKNRPGENDATRQIGAAMAAARRGTEPPGLPGDGD
jgi:hypothetical protein